MIEKIPILAMQVTDVWAEGNDASTGFEAAERLGQCRLKHLLGGKMFKEIAREDDVEGVIRKGPLEAAILLNKFNVGPELFSAGRIEVHRELLHARHIVDELSVPAAEVENTVSWFDPSGEEFGSKNLPYTVSIALLPREARGVKLL